MLTLSVRTCLLALLCVLGAACSDQSDQSDPPPALEPELAAYSFNSVDERFQAFLDDSAVFDGISYSVVDSQQGVVHRAALGDHDTDIVVLLASTSKMPVAVLLLALQDDPEIDFDIDTPIGNYLPWVGVYGDRTVAQLLSNTSGIPGLGSIGDYGAHLCQYAPTGTLESCAQIIYANELPGSSPPGTGFDYGGSQWQLAGAVAEVVSNSQWRQVVDTYLAEPCEMDVFRFGNPWSDLSVFNGSPDSLQGMDNPNIEGGAISNMDDYNRILLMLLQGGRCGDQQILSEASIAELQLDRGGEFGTPYGMGWWLLDSGSGDPVTVFYDPGAFGAVSWIDVERNIGGYVAIDDYSRQDSGAPIVLVLNEIIPLVQAEVDAARAAVAP